MFNLKFAILVLSNHNKIMMDKNDISLIEIENYKTYLKFLNEKLSIFFDSQKPFLFCKKGCAYCCKNAEFPYSEIEIKYLLSGVAKLDKDIQNKIEQNIKNILELKKDFNGKKYLYDCPFLIDNICSIYDYRGVVCRSFGLITDGNNNNVKIPFCSYKGLNYSNVMDIDTNQLSQEKINKLNIKEQPVGFNASYEFLTNPDFGRAYNFVFREIKPLIEWFNI